MCSCLDSLSVTVMGLGHHGGGTGVVTWLLDQGANVCLTDTASPETLEDSMAVLSGHPRVDRLRVRLGGHDERDFTGSDLIVVNPGVPHPWSNPLLQAACCSGVAVTTEIRLLLDHLKTTRIIGITGSVGKSTTAAMVHHILQHVGLRSHLGGNIGGSLLERLPEIEADDWVILELSSFMLHWLDEGMGHPDAPGWSPRVAVLTSIEPNHLDWHESMSHYTACKERIFAFQPTDGLQIRPDDPPPWPDDAALIVPGRHNQENASRAALIAARAAGVLESRSTEALASFPGLPHRLCHVPTGGGFLAIDDSKASTPTATCLAVDAFDDPSRVHLIAGGYDKGGDLSSIARLGASLGGLYAIGATAETLVNTAAEWGITAHHCGTLREAVGAAIARLRSGDVLLLSPGCASWDQFRDFRERGDAFTALVKDASIATA